MSRRELCDDRIKVTLSVHGDRTLLFVKDGSAVRFWTDTALLKRAIEGVPAEIDAFGGHCCIHVDGSNTRVDFRSDEGREYSCTFQTQTMADALSEGVGDPATFE